MLGVILMILGFGLGSVLIYTVKDLDFLKYVMYPVFVLVGAGWATINVHSFVMSVEMATEKRPEYLPDCIIRSPWRRK